MEKFRLVGLTLLLCSFAVATSVSAAGDGDRPLRYQPAAPVLALFKEGSQKFESNDFAGAERDMSAVIKQDPKFSKPYYVRACCRHLQGDYDGALADCDQSIILEPNGNPIYYFERAVTESKLNKLDECIRDCDVAIKRAPGFPGSYMYRAQAKAKKGDKKGALVDCDAYLKSNPTDKQALKLKERLQSAW